MTQIDDSLASEIESAKEQGWQLKEKNEDQATLIKRRKGSIKAHLVIAVLTIWWTFGVGNIFYLIYKYYWDSETRIVNGDTSIEKSESTAGIEQPREDQSKEQEGSTAEKIELLPFAEERYGIVYSGGKFVGSIPGVRLIFKMTVIWYRFVVLHALNFIERFRKGSRLIKRYKVDTHNIYNHFFAGYRGESKPSLRHSLE